MDGDLSIVGKRLPRPDTAEKATGAALYSTDINLPGALIGKVLRSPLPHARILKIDKTKAEVLPGVKAVITFEDVPKRLYNISALDIIATERIVKGFKKDQYVLTDKARHVGDAVAAVAASNESIAEAALELIHVEYEELPAVFGPEEAMKPDAPRIHDSADNNIAWYQPLPTNVGDVKKGFDEADYIIEETFRTSKSIHCQLEPTACMARFDSSGKLTIWSSSQEVFPKRRKIAELFDMREGMIRWITPHVGGVFGNGIGLRAEPVCVALAKKTGMPVKMQYSREEQFIATETRHPVILTGKIGVTKDGSITALQVNVIMDAGAYISCSSAVANNVMARFAWLYRCPNTRGEVNIVYTNTPVAGAFRGFGNPQAMWALEQLIDMASERIGMEPMEFRLLNHRRTGDPSWIPHVPIENCAFDECIKLGADSIGWKDEMKKEGAKRQGMGMAIIMQVSGTFPINLEHTNAFIKLNEDGSASLMVSACDMGQGILGALGQIAAEELGLCPEDIHLVSGDTDITMFDPGQHGSRSCYVMGNAVMKAARQAKVKLLERAAKTLEVSSDDLEAREGWINVKGSPDKGISIADVARDAIYNFKGESLNISGKCSWEPRSNSPSCQAAFAHVEVDVDTAEVKVLKIVLAHDIGRAINPMTVEGQLEGAIVQSIGYCLSEAFRINQNSGIIESDNFTTYKIPSAPDLPKIKVILVEQPVASGPFGAKSVGEAGMNAIAPAIGNAVYDAVSVRIRDLPITPEKVLGALLEKKRDCSI
ncbi:MAG: molybdopterin-dependent oxidoreductase [Deltaproteobacteria bacterium]|nr:molybdopterin-dependent oxidoreductase [Deltaproteobacteria bacterium]